MHLPVIQARVVPEMYQSMTHQELSDWYNQWADCPQDATDLSTAILYADLLEYSFPGSVEEEKLNRKPRNNKEKIENWVEVQRAMGCFHIEKEIVPAQMATPNTSAGLDFARWFVCFFEKNNPEQAHDD